MAEHKPEVLTDVEQDSSIIQRVLMRWKPVLLRSLNTFDDQTGFALRDGWDVVHFDCVVGPQGQLYLDDSEISPDTAKYLSIRTSVCLFLWIATRSRWSHRQIVQA